MYFIRNGPFCSFQSRDIGFTQSLTKQRLFVTSYNGKSVHKFVALAPTCARSFEKSGLTTYLFNGAIGARYAPNIVQIRNDLMSHESPLT